MDPRGDCVLLFLPQEWAWRGRLPSSLAGAAFQLPRALARGQHHTVTPPPGFRFHQLRIQTAGGNEVTTQGRSRHSVSQLSFPWPLGSLMAAPGAIVHAGWGRGGLVAMP